MSVLKFFITKTAGGTFTSPTKLGMKCPEKKFLIQNMWVNKHPRSIAPRRYFVTVQDPVVYKSKPSVRVADTTNITDGASPAEIEKEMFILRQKMTASYSKGSYKLALEFAEELESRTTLLMGKNNAVYASCLNNVALMHKMLGNKDQAMNIYTDALHVYEDVAVSAGSSNGKETPSYAATLCNLGVLYKETAESARGVERQELLLRSEEALTDAQHIRSKVLGPVHKDTLYSAVHLAALLRLQDRTEKAIPLLIHTLEQAEASHGSHDTLCATIRNNLGMIYKAQARYAEAKEHYTQALQIRSKVLGDEHPDSIVSRHNLAELLHAEGDEQGALALQEELVHIIARREEADLAHTQKQEQQKKQGKRGEKEEENDLSASKAAVSVGPAGLAAAAGEGMRQQQDEQLRSQSKQQQGGAAAGPLADVRKPVTYQSRTHIPTSRKNRKVKKK